MVPRAMGPYAFVKYKGPMKLTAILRGPEGRVIECSSSHLLPFRDAAPMAAGAGGPGRGGVLSDLLAPPITYHTDPITPDMNTPSDPMLT